jgi:hypothetical protein
MFVLKGERPGGGGKTVFEFLTRRRVERTSVGSGTEPVTNVSAHVRHGVGRDCNGAYQETRTLRQFHIRRGQRRGVSIANDAFGRRLLRGRKDAVQVLDAMLVARVFGKGETGFTVASVSNPLRAL